MAKSVVAQTTAQVGESARKVSEFASSVADGVHDGINAAKNAVQDGRAAVEDFVDDTARRVKRSPIESVLLTLSVGVAIGFLLGRATANG